MTEFTSAEVPLEELCVIKTREAAERLGVNEATITRWVKTGFLTKIRTPGGHFRIREREVQEILDGKFNLPGDRSP